MSADRLRCQEAARLLQRAFAGELSVSERLAWEAHRAECPRCDREAIEQERVVESLGTYREAPLQRVDLDRFVEKVQARLEPRTASAPPLVWPRRVAAAACLAVLAGGAWWWSAHSQSNGAPDPPVAPTDEVAAQAAPEPQPPTPLTEPGESFDERLRAEVLLGLSEQLAAPEPELPHEQYLDGLRREGWPVAHLLTRIAREHEAPLAETAVAQLVALNDRTALRQLYSLRDESAAGPAAVAGLLAVRPVAFDWVQRLYAEPTHADAVRTAWAQWTAEEALEGARRWQRASRRQRPDAEALLDLAGLLGRAGTPGLLLGLDWLANAEFDGTAWAQALAQQPGLDFAVRDWLAQPNSVPGRGIAGMLDLAELHRGSMWSGWVAQHGLDSKHGARAVAVLGTLPDMGALRELYRIGQSSRVDRDAWLAAWRGALAADARRTEWLGIEVVPADASGARREDGLRTLGEALLLAPGPATAQLMAWVASGLPGTDALTIALWEQVAQHADLGTLSLLDHTWENLADNQTRQAASLVLCFAALGGEPSLRELLAIAPDQPLTLSERRLFDAALPPNQRSFRERVFLLERSLRGPLASRRSVPSK